MLRETEIDNILVIVSGEISDEEIKVYLKDIHKRNHHDIVVANIKVDGEFVDVKYTYGTPPFERIRRITGYLVGTTDRWNNAKRSEERDRVKHGVRKCGSD